MRRLTRLARLTATRLRRLAADESGAAAVMIALMGVVLFGFAALAIDYGAIQAQRAELQNAADAVALAVAHDCASGNAAGCAANGSGVGLGSANGAETTTALLDTSARTVTATTTSVVEHWFAPVLGIESTTVGADATAQWTAPTPGAQVVTRARVYPFAIEACRQPAGLPSVRLDISTGTKLCGGPYQATGGRAFVVLQTDGWCDKSAVSAGDTQRQLASGNLLCLVPSGPIIVQLWDEVSRGQNVNRRDYTISSFALFQPDSSLLTGVGISGRFIPMNFSHPDVLETSGDGSDSAGTVTLID